MFVRMNNKETGDLKRCKVGVDAKVLASHNI